MAKAQADAPHRLRVAGHQDMNSRGAMPYVWRVTPIAQQSVSQTVTGWKAASLLDLQAMGSACRGRDAYSGALISLPQYPLISSYFRPSCKLSDCTNSPLERFSVNCSPVIIAP